MQKSFVKEFKLYCKKKNLDVNSHQIKLIKTLEEYYKLNYKSFISKIKFLDFKRCEKNSILGK